MYHPKPWDMRIQIIFDALYQLMEIVPQSSAYFRYTSLDLKTIVSSALIVYVHVLTHITYCRCGSPPKAHLMLCVHAFLPLHCCIPALGEGEHLSIRAV